MSAAKKQITAKPTLAALNLTNAELEHLNELFSVILPSEKGVTVSEELAQTCSRVVVEQKLWEKIKKLCDKQGIVTGDDSPDYAVVPVGPPPMGLVRVEVERK
jgi:adenosylmethionine-8-amino-7-oxononanoate aminotransferase